MEIKKIDPSEHEYCYVLTEDTCFKLKSGECSLNLTKENFRKYKSEENKDDKNMRNSVHYCRSLYENIKTNGLKNPVKIVKYSCGHFGFSDGQHRICIAKNKIMKDIPALIGNNLRKCSVCDSTRNICFLG